LANEILLGAPGIPVVELVAAVVLVAGETAKMRPSKQGAAGARPVHVLLAVGSCGRGPQVAPG
jgi:hypothetical protein